MASKSYKLDIFGVLNKINKKDRKFFKELSEDGQKAFAPFVIMRWLTGIKNPLQVFLVNEIVNPFIFSLGNHKELIYNLLTITTQDPNTRYYWQKNAKKQYKFPKSVNILSNYLEYSSNQAAESLQFFDNDDIIQMAEELGKQKQDIRDIKKELKNR